MKKTVLSLLVQFVVLQSFAQLTLPELGNNPSNIKWKYYKTPAAQIIFPSGNDSQARRVANIINYIYGSPDSLTVSVGSKRKHLPLLIQTNQVISNGYVGLSPYRSEFFATGLQNFNELGSIDWLDVLSFHEYRHALQNINGRRGLTALGYYVGGEGFWALLYNASVPNWYAEGDAVQTETVLSEAGRGRTPYFFKEQKALLFNNRNYTYMKARDGSFKSLLPDHYRLGYAMLHQVRNDNGPETWKRVLARGSSYRSVFYPFSRALKHETGYTTRKMYYKTYANLKAEWENQLKNVQLIPTTQVSAEPKTVSFYQWPHQLTDGSIVCIKGSFQEIPYLTKIKDGKEQNLCVLGVTTEPFLSVNNNKAAWVEMSTDKRWQNKNYNEIIGYDLTTNTRKKITSQTKLFSPEFAASGNAIVAVKADEHIQNHIVFIDPATGNETAAIENPTNDFISYPRWTKDDKAIVFIAKRNSKIALLKYDIATKNITELTPWSRNVIAGIYIAQNDVYYTASYSGINNIYKVALDGSKDVKQVSSVKIDAEMPFVSADESTLLMSEFDVMGYKITKQAISASAAKSITIVEPLNMEIYNIKTTAQEHAIQETIPNNDYPQANYTGLIRGAKLHTWGVSSELNGIGANFKINNILNDFAANISIGYNRNEKTVGFGGTVDYGRFYLPISLGATVNDRITPIYDKPLETRGDSVNFLDIKFKEAIYNLNIALPLTWINGAYTTHLKIIGGAQQIVTSDYKLNDTSLNNSSFNFTDVNAAVIFTNLRQTAYQQVLPRFGQKLTATYNQSVSSTDALKYLITGTIYLPGLLRNHSLSFTGSWTQQKRTNNYRYLDNFNHARGYTALLGDDEYVVSANYQLPVLYPDFGFGGLAYLKRVRLNVFGDFSQVKRDDINKTFSQNSVGGELYFDLKVGHLLPISLGTRYSSLLDKDFYDSGKTSFFEFFLGGIF